MAVNDALSVLLNALQLRPSGSRAIELACTVPGSTQMVVMNSDGSLATQAIPTGGGGGGSYTEVANKAARPDPSAPGQFVKNLSSGVVYVSFNNAWKPIGLAVTGTDDEQDALIPSELEVNMQFTTTGDGPITSVWNGVNWISEGP